jgi:N-acetylglucosaminyl-diphospho-decaprenol L-rhamnosyltransferase
MPHLSIVIVSFNSRRELDGCLRSLAAAPPRLEHEVVIVDNASSDGTTDYLRERWPGVRVVEAGSNRGFAGGNNLGIRQTTGDLVLLLNPDTLVPAGAIDQLVSFLDAHPQIGIVGPRITDGEGRAELSFGPMISPLAEMRQKLLVVGHARRVAFIRSIVERMTTRSRQVDWVSGACLLARRSDLEAVGLLDETFFFYTEDVDLCASVRARGKGVHFLAEAEIVHLRGRSAASAPRSSEIAYRRSQIAFYEKHHPRWAPLLRLYLKMRGRLPDNQG